jgi:RNA 3'-terminal phosphate cyclase (ATP)
MLTIDGAMGEGGGQVLRTSLALSAVTRKPFRIEGIRAKRKRPGLLRQHLTAVRAIAQVCGARVSGDELGSSAVTFEPGETKHGDHHFVVGTAGSATLVFQTVLPPLLIAEGRSRLIFEGGTHNPMAPPFDFMAQTFLPLLHRMGASVSAELGRHGFYPAGGGRFVIDMVGGTPLDRLSLLERGKIERVSIKAIVSKIPEHVALREVKALAGQLADLPIEIDTAQVESAGPGNVVTVTVHAAGLTETFTSFGEVGVRAEKIAHSLAGEVRKYIAAGAPVGLHLADQLLIPFVLAGGGDLHTMAPTLHTRTNAEVINRFMLGRVELDGNAGLVRVKPAASRT